MTEDAFDTVFEELRSSGREWCPYCLEPRLGKASCCGENHFALFEDLDQESQQAMVEWELQ